MQGLPHAEDMLVMYLPKEKIVAFADMYNVPPANNPVPNPPVISTVVLMDNLARLGLDFDTLVSTKNGCNLQPFLHSELLVIPRCGRPSAHRQDHSACP
jgi:hypothetical protein